MTDVASLMDWRRRSSGCSHGTGGGTVYIVQRGARNHDGSQGSTSIQKCYEQSPSDRPGENSYVIDGALLMLGLPQDRPCFVIDPPGHTRECLPLSIFALLLRAWAEDGDAAGAVKAALVKLSTSNSSVVAVACSVMLDKLEELKSHPAALQHLLFTHELSGITRALRCLMVVALAGGNSDVCDEMHVLKSDVFEIMTPHTLVPLAAGGRLIQALGLRAAILHDCGGIVRRHDVGTSDSPFLGGLFVRDAHTSAVMFEGHAPEPQPAASTSLRITVVGAACACA